VGRRDELDLDGGGLGHFGSPSQTERRRIGSARIWAQPTDLRPVVKRNATASEARMNTPVELLHKLQVKSGARLWLINVPRAIAEELSAGAEVEIVHESDAYDGVIA